MMRSPGIGASPVPVEGSSAPAVAAEDVGGQHLGVLHVGAAGPAREDVLGAGDPGGIGVHVDLDVGEDELDVGRVGEDGCPGPAHLGPAADHVPARVDAADLVVMLPAGLHPVHVQGLEGGVELLVGLGHGVEIGLCVGLAHVTPQRSIASVMRTALTSGPTSWTRTIRAPRSTAHTTVAAVPSTRSSAGLSRARPMNALRLVPTSTGWPSRVRRARSSSRAKLSRSRLPNPIPGSTTRASWSTPANSAARQRSARN